jgi:hypothetical protein
MTGKANGRDKADYPERPSEVSMHQISHDGADQAVQVFLGLTESFDAPDLSQSRGKQNGTGQEFF